MEDRAAKFKKFIEQLPRLCSPTICGTLSQPATKPGRGSKNSKRGFEWSMEQKAILSPANITAATSSEFGEVNDHSFLHQESEQFFSQKCIAPSPMTTPSTRPYSRSQPVPRNWSNYMFDEREEDTSEEDEDEEDEDDEQDTRHEDDEDEFEELNDCSMMSATSQLNESNPVRTQAPRIRSTRRRSSKRRDSDTDIEMDVLDDQTDVDTDNDRDSSHAHDTDQDDDDDDDDDDMTDVENNDPDDKSDEEDGENSKAERDMDSLFLSPPMRSSQSQQRFDIFSPQTFERVMDDEHTLQSTPKTTGSQLFRQRVRRVSDMSD